MQNKIINGDAYELIKGLEDKSIDCIYTDIPYLIKHGGKGDSELSLRIHREYTVDLKDIKNGIDYSILDEFVRVLKKVNCFIWCSKEQIYDIMHYFYTHTHELHNSCLVQNKSNPGYKW